jgi:hypothetical protein
MHLAPVYAMNQQSQTTKFLCFQRTCTSREPSGDLTTALGSRKRVHTMSGPSGS